MMEQEYTEKNSVVGGTLYITATPIGNMADLSERAVKVLKEVDFVAAEDTRVTMKLLSMLGIKKETVSYYEHNKTVSGKQILERLKNGESAAIVTDAGTPAISDPGEDLVALCASNGVPVVSIPGACAAITALTVSGLPTAKFVFEGFLPVKGKERRDRLAKLSDEERTTVIYEAPHRLTDTLGDLYIALGDRKITICRELTKLNEEILRTSLSQAVEIYKEKQPRGEYVLVLGGAEKAETEELSNEEIIGLLNAKIDGGMSAKLAVREVAAETGMGKNAVYDIYISEKDK